MTVPPLDVVAQDIAQAVGALHLAIRFARRDGTFPIVARSTALVPTGRARAKVSVPLLHGGCAFGVLEAHRSSPSPWRAEHVAALTERSAQSTTTILASWHRALQQQRLANLGHATESLREHNHEQANQIHAIAALLAMGDAGEARRFAGEVLRSYEVPDVVGRIGGAFGGFLIAQCRVAADMGVVFEIDEGSRLPDVRGTASEAKLVVLADSLLDFAFDGMAAPPRCRHEVRLLTRFDDRGFVLRAHDRAQLRRPRTHMPVTELTLRATARVLGASLTMRMKQHGTSTCIRIPF